MVRTVRLTVALAAVALMTPPMMLWQSAALALPFLNERIVPRIWHRAVTRLLGLRVHTHGRIAAARPLLIAANHVSWTDIVVLSALADVHFIARADMSNWPLIGTLARLQRSVFVERERRRSSGLQAGEIGARLTAGDPMVLFAEGTTGDGNRLLPFKSTLFAAAQMALEAGGAEAVTVQPVAIAYTRLHGMPMGRALRPQLAWIGDMPLMPHLRKLLEEGAVDVEVHFGEPVAFRAGADRKQIARQAEDSVRAMMTQALRRPA